MTFLLIFAAVVLLAYANGANDNFKGVATLFGSGAAPYGRSLGWATVTTLAGSLAALALAGQLLKNFSGRGLVSDVLAADPRYVAAVALGAGLTVLLATKLGMPISTTHGLVGALVGAGWAAGAAIDGGKLAGQFFMPLMLSPVLAATCIALFYPILHQVRLRLGICEESCLCVGNEPVEVVPLLTPAVALERATALSVSLGTEVSCHARYRGQLLGVSVPAVLDRLHFLSAGLVGFARGLNDTPKIAALLLIAPALEKTGSLILVALAIAVGGLVSARRVAETMSRRITTLNHGQGLSANAATSTIVLAASFWGLPVSTTHVSCGALFGMGAVTGQARWKMIGQILLAWITTLPAAAALGACSYWLLSA